MFGGDLLVGTIMITASVVVHATGLVWLASFLPRLAVHLRRARAKVVATCVLIVAVLVVIGIHTIEAWGWAALYYALGEFADFERALYFSVVTSTTLGYGDVVLSEDWQLLSTFEAMGGLILFGVSTAFLLRVMQPLFEETLASDEPT